jgi:hypothetical protein
MELLRHPRLFDANYWGELGANLWVVVLPFSVGASVLSVVCPLVAYPVTLRLLRARQRSKGEDAEKSL